ncbi:pantoate--beta-alanine ligase [Altererythrobacter lauratis]|uniref:Pantothenate synthetase n=1 Tax=Alteraurantiacibacter lauratis TaxID=2054627 RepID=A0ABV7EDC7_9SPHN
MQTINRLNTLKQAVEDLRQSGTVALVPTMGALHAGHVALVRRARELADHVVVSIFVNPTQFGPNEDLARYPRDLAADQALLAAEGAALIWAPDAAEMYPAGFATSVAVEVLSANYCGAVRPGHFAGVATVVLKLFNQVRPNFAVFGEKDWQQLAVIRRMVQDLNLTLPCVENIVGVPIVREEDGLALSSRNAYLSAADRRVAGQLNALMRRAIAQIETGDEVRAALTDLENALLAAGFASVDYAALADAESLAPLGALTGSPARLLVAARIGTTRLIDNMPVAAG